MPSFRRGFPDWLREIREKYLYLPFQYNTIFLPSSAKAGLVGALMIMALFAALILRGYWIALQAGTVFLRCCAPNVTLIAIQVVLNMVL